jgi:NADP-dependent 3-hydroxy acid dehydrogenase YdfG
MTTTNVIVITGASSGFGALTARTLARVGLDDLLTAAR